MSLLLSFAPGWLFVLCGHSVVLWGGDGYPSIVRVPWIGLLEQRGFLDSFCLN